MLPMPFPLHSLVHLSNQLLSYINCEGLKLTRKQSLSSQDQCLGRDKSSRGLLEGPWEYGWEGLDSAWGVGKLRLGHISRARHRCSEAATGAKTDQGINTTQAQGGRQRLSWCLSEQEQGLLGFLHLYPHPHQFQFWL